MKKIILSALAISAIVFTSCDEEGTPVVGPEVVTPATYEFKDAKGESTVSYSGQLARLEMGSELKTALGADTSLEALTNMFVEGKGFTNAELDKSGKIIKTTIAAESTNSILTTEQKEAFRAKVEGWLKEYAENVVPNKGNDASEGKAGFLTYKKDDEEKKRYFNAKGFEMNQLFAKGGMIGGVILDQVVNKYISEKYLSDAIEAHETGAPYKEGKNYTKLEHGWDEAYGYVFGQVSEKNVFLGKYLGSVEKDPDFAGIKSEIETAFRTGRAAIVAKNYEVMSKQAEIIREGLSKVVAIRTVFYMMISTDATMDTATRFHALSEGYGFLNALQFAHHGGKQMPVTHIESELKAFEANNGLWDIIKDENATLTTASEKIAKMFGFTVKQAKSIKSEAETN